MQDFCVCILYPATLLNLVIGSNNFLAMFSRLYYHSCDQLTLWLRIFVPLYPPQFPHPPILSPPSWYPPVTSQWLWVYCYFVHFVLFCFLHSTSNWNHMVFLSTWLISLSIIFLFYGWIIFHCLYVAHLYPFIYCWTLWLLPVLDCCK